MKKRNLYLLVLTSCLAGFAWLIYVYSSSAGVNGNETGICMFKHVAHIPCPSCGSTRSVFELLSGNIKESLLINPFGFLIFIVIFVSPIWILYDKIFKRETFYNFYNLTEHNLKKRSIAIPAIVLVIANWIWNICKGL